MRVPLSWLRDFAPFSGAPADLADLAATLDDLGLVVEGMETVGEGLGDIVVVRVIDIAPIEGADRIRKVVVDDGTDLVEVVCGASNFAVDDLVALAPVGAVLPGGFAIGRRKMKGVTSNGMLCSGRELGLSEDHAGILVLNDTSGAAVGRLLVDVLGIETDVIFDIAVEANRPDALSIAGVARDLAARLDLPFAVPSPADLDAGPVVGPPIGSLASVRVDDLELCPRLLARVLTGVSVAPSPEWMARRLTLAGMRPINNVVDASNYVMLELGQPTHPYDLDRLPGEGLLVRRAEPGETLTTLDGMERTLGVPGPALGDTGQDSLICDATGSPVAIGGIMGGASSEIGASTERVLLEAAYFVPMAIARTSKRLSLRTEASARFERGCDPAGIDRASVRFCELLALTAGPEMRVAEGVIDVVGEVPVPIEITVRPLRVNALLGATFSAARITELLTPLGMSVSGSGESEALTVTVPTFRPDIRPAPFGEADIAEEVARTFGYSRIVRRLPAWPQPGLLTGYQKERRRLKAVLCGIGANEVWTETFVSESDQVRVGIDPPYIEVTNPLVESERYLRGSMAPGLLRALLYNTERRQGNLRLFEVGSVFGLGTYGDGTTGRDADQKTGPAPRTPERMSAVLADEGDDAWSAVAAWRAIADALRIGAWTMGERSIEGSVVRVVHPFRSASVFAGGNPDAVDDAPAVGVIGEIDPQVVEAFGLVGKDGRPRRVAWIDLDLSVLLDPGSVPRRPEEVKLISRYPSSDIDLAFVAPDAVPAGSVERTLRAAGGDLMESVDLFDVYRDPSIGSEVRSLAFHLRFCALDRTLTDEEVGDLRQRCIESVREKHGAILR